MKRNLTLSQAVQIREMRRQGVPIREVCRLFNTNANTVYQIQVGMAYREAASVEDGQANVDGPAVDGGIKGEE